MFFPVRDDNPTRTTPFVNYLLIALNVAVFSWTRSSGDLATPVGEVPEVVEAFGLVPRRFLADVPGQLYSVFTSMFMHGGWYHLLSNMWFLHLFGDNVEDTLGHGRYVFFYLLCGIAAAVAQVAIDPTSPIPMVGASGAIGGVVGGYLMLYPRAPILSVNMVPLLWLFLGTMLVVPAWVIGAMFLGQNLLLAFQNAAGFGSNGIAFSAHLGGFFAGLLIVRLLAIGRTIERRVWPGARLSRRSWASVKPSSRRFR
jgi:membrane associated rhomboid family serine protease